MKGELTEVVTGLGGGVTVAVACADFVVSAWAVAVMVALRLDEVVGAVYKPDDEMVLRSPQIRRGRRLRESIPRPVSGRDEGGDSLRRFSCVLPAFKR